MPASASVGTLGHNEKRFLVVTASARMRPLSTKFDAPPGVVNNTGISPCINASGPALPPLYGT